MTLTFLRQLTQPLRVEVRRMAEPPPKGHVP